MKPLPTLVLVSALALAVLCAGAAGPVRAWTVLSAKSCETAGSYQYQKQVTLTGVAIAQNTLVSVTAEWRPSPLLTQLTINTLGKGSVSVRQLCKADSWAGNATCTDTKVTSQSSPGWGIAQVTKAAPDALAPKGLVPFPAAVPVPAVASQAWGGGRLPIMIAVSGTGARCSKRFDELRLPNGAVNPWGPWNIPPGGIKYTITEGLIAGHKQYGTFALRSRIDLWTGAGWKAGAWSPWVGFVYAPTLKRGPPGSFQQAPQGPTRPKP